MASYKTWATKMWRLSFCLFAFFWLSLHYQRCVTIYVRELQACLFVVVVVVVFFG